MLLVTIRVVTHQIRHGSPELVRSATVAVFAVSFPSSRASVFIVLHRNAVPRAQGSLSLGLLCSLLAVEAHCAVVASLCSEAMS